MNKAILRNPLLLIAPGVLIAIGLPWVGLPLAALICLAALFVDGSNRRRAKR